MQYTDAEADSAPIMIDEGGGGDGELQGASGTRGKVSLQELRELFSAAAPTFARTFLLQTALTGAAAVAARSDGGPAVGSAAHQVTALLWLFSSFTLDALAVAAQVPTSPCLHVGVL